MMAADGRAIWLRDIVQVIRHEEGQAELVFFFSSRRRHTRSLCDWSSDVCSSDLEAMIPRVRGPSVQKRRDSLIALEEEGKMTEAVGWHALIPGPITGPDEALAFKIGRASCRERV